MMIGSRWVSGRHAQPAAQLDTGLSPAASSRGSADPGRRLLQRDFGLVAAQFGIDA
jgi:hypothetical protein